MYAPLRIPCKGNPYRTQPLICGPAREYQDVSKRPRLSCEDTFPGRSVLRQLQPFFGFKTMPAYGNRPPEFAG